MAVTVVDSGSVHGFLGSAPEVTLSGTPAAGDFIVVAVGTDSTALLANVTGMGATWTVHYANSDVWQSFAFAVGVGATTSGTVTATMDATRMGIMRAFVVRGLPSGTTWSASAARNTSGSTLSGPSSAVANGDFVLECAVVSDATLANWTSWSGTGYTFGTAVAATFVAANTGYLLPTSSTTAQTSASVSSSPPKGIAQLVGTPPAASLGVFEAPSPSAAAFEPAGNPVWTASFTARARSSAAFEPIGSAHVSYPASTVYFTAPSPSRALMAPALRPAAPPATITHWPVTVEAHIMPALSEAQQSVAKFVDYTPLVGTLGRFQIWVDGQPVTYLRDVPTIVEDYSSADPLGDDGARFVCKQIHPWDVLGTGDLAMFDMPSDPPVDIAFEDEDGNLTHVWDGSLASHGDSTTATDEGRTFTAEGTLKQAAHWPWTPPAYMEPTDPGVVFARAMNSVPNRRYAAFVEVETGLPPITYRGSQSQSILDYALEVLSKMTATDGRQWTTVKVGPRNYQLVLNPTLDTYDAAIVKGAEGVDVRLVEDEVTRVDGYFGQGIAPNGGQWGNFFFPGLDLFIPPPYPYNDTTETIYIGDTDAGTDTGDGVTVAQRRLVELGYPVAVDGTFNSADAAAVTQMQTDFGLLVDGRIGPQTWSSLFSPGVNEVDLGRIRLPLVSKPWVMEHLYAANGAEIGTNPAWDNKPIPHMPNINFGSDITKSEATVLARKMLEQNGEAVWTGPIDLLTDLVAPDGVTPISRFLVREGWRIKIIGHDGDVIVRVGKASKDDLRVSLSVDEKARDALTLDAIAARDRHALRETKPRPGNPQKISALIRDHVTQYEDESKAGKIPAYPVNGNVGLWSVFPIFVSQTGSIAKFVMNARNVKTTFSVAFFGAPIQPQVLAGYVPDPISNGDGWRDHYETLTLDHALIAIYGEPGALGGFAPRVESDGGPITGDLFDDSGFPFESQVGGYLWVAVFASASCNVSGRAFPGVPL